MVELYNELIIGSGGIKGVALIGGLNELFKKYPLHNIKYLTGCSVGSIICLLLNLSYTIEEINNIIFNINFENFQELKVINLIEKCGFDEGLKFSNFYKALILNKNINPDITFKELYDNTNIILTTVAVNTTKGITEYHNYINTPNMSVVLAIRMSTNIPILFSPIIYNNNYYIDGALLDPFPYKYHKNTVKIGLCIFYSYEYQFLKNNEVEFFNGNNDSFGYMFNLIKILYTNYLKHYFKKIPKNVIYLNIDLKDDYANFSLSRNEKQRLFNYGIKKTRIFFNKLFKKRKKIYLDKKYVQLWKLKTIMNKSLNSVH